MSTFSRRDFLWLCGAGVACAATTSPRKPLRGIFPIAQTPFTASGKLDLDALAEEVRFVDRCGAHGFVWPQLASEYSTLTESERFEGAEVILSNGGKLRPAIVIGVQAPDIPTAARYARQAERLGADAVIALPPPKQSDPNLLLEYYKGIGASTGLPLFMQAIGDIPVEFILRMANEIPTLRCIKDEAGASPLPRIAALRERLQVFTGSHGVTLIDEMIRGSSGNMPSASFADLYAQAWDLWHAGRNREAVDLFSKAIVFVPEAQVYGIQALKYILYLRGVFPRFDVRIRDAKAPFDESAQRALREMYESLKPSLKS
jgi:4-hydroxy-tetrahydrodipicolinate synthase